MEYIKKVKQWFVLISCMLLIANTVQAAEKGSVMNGYTLEDSVLLYIKDEGQEIKNIYIGNEPVKSFTKEVSETSRTIVLLDNSLSIASRYRENIKTFLTDLIAARNNGDLFTIATFSEDTHYLVQDSADYLAIKEQIAALEFINQDTYFNKALYQLLEDLENEEETGYTKVIIIADGIENEKLGYTQEELERKLTEVKVPVYTLGCLSDGNEESLKQMFALSRISNGRSFLMDNDSIEDILKTIKDESNVYKVYVIPQDKVCDGGKQVVRISFGADFCQTDMKMPFIEVLKETVETTSIFTESTTSMENVLAKPEIKSQNEEVGRFSVMLLILVAIAGGILVFFLAWSFHKKHNKRGSQTKNTVTEGKTVILSEQREEEEPFTKPLVHKNTVRLILQDVDQIARSFEYPLRDQVIIGKDKKKCQIVVDYDSSVSGVHCKVFKRENRYYVRDIGTNGIASTNGTYVDNQKATPELEVRSGSILKLGRVKFKVNFK